MKRMKYYYIVLFVFLIISLLPLHAIEIFPENDEVIIKPEQQVNTADEYKETPPAPPTSPSIQQTQTNQTQQNQQIQQQSKSPKVKETKYIVKKGDYLWKIAQQLLGDGSRYREIIEANKNRYPSLVKNPNIIHPGWELIIPTTEQIPNDQVANNPKPSQNTSTSQSSQPSNQQTTQTSQQTQQSTSESNKPYINIPTDRPLTTQEKIKYLQEAINIANVKLNLKISELNTKTVRLMIDKNIISEEGWMALNPPQGYRWVLKDGRVTLASNQESTNQQQANQQQQQGSNEQQQQQNLATTTPNALERFKKDLEKMNMPLIVDTSGNWFSKKARDYNNAIYKAASYHKDYWKFTYASYEHEFGVSVESKLDLYSLQYELMQAHKLYEQKVKEGATDKFLGLIGDTIETAAQKVMEAKQKLQNAWEEFKKVHTAAKNKLNLDKAEIAKLETQKKEAEEKLNKLDRFDPQNGPEVQRLMKTIKEKQQKIDEISQKMSRMNEILNIFP